MAGLFDNPLAFIKNYFSSNQCNLFIVLHCCSIFSFINDYLPTLVCCWMVSGKYSIYRCA